MVERKRILADGVFTGVILLGIFCLIVLLQSQFETRAMTPMISVLGVFL